MSKSFGKAAAEIHALQEGGNHIRNLMASKEDLQKRIDTCKISINTFKQHLHGPKFSGVDSDGERKDWISVADVLRWLADIESDLN